MRQNIMQQQAQQFSGGMGAFGMPANMNMMGGFPMMGMPGMNMMQGMQQQQGYGAPQRGGGQRGGRGRNPFGLPQNEGPPQKRGRTEYE